MMTVDLKTAISATVLKYNRRGVAYCGIIKIIVSGTVRNLLEIRPGSFVKNGFSREL